MTTRATRSRAGRTREAILGILRRRSGRSVGDLARELGLAGATVRRHLDGLLRDGLVSAGQLRGRTGRPRYVFSLTGEGAELFGRRRARLTRRLLREIAALRPGETAGRRGADLAGLVLARLGERIAAEYAPRVGGRGAGERARAAAALLADEGFEFEVRPDAAGGGLRLIGRDCPRRRLRRGFADPAAADGARCGDDRDLLAALVGGPVEAVRDPERYGDGVCVYALRAR